MYRQATPEKYKHINFKPPESVANAAVKGLEYRQKASPSNRGGLTTEEAGEQGIGSGVQRASNLKNRSNLSPEVVRQMHAFFSRHEKNKSIAAEHKDEPWNDKGYVAWLLWGGDPGQSWAAKIVAQMEAADEKAKTAAAPKPPTEGATLIDQTSDRAFWKAKRGSQTVWLITKMDGVIDRDAPEVGGFAGNYMKARDGKAAWAQVKGKKASARRVAALWLLVGRL